MLVEKLLERERLESERLIKKEGMNLSIWQKEIIGVSNQTMQELILKFAKGKKLTGAEMDILVEFYDFYIKNK